MKLDEKARCEHCYGYMYEVAELKKGQYLIQCDRCRMARQTARRYAKKKRTR